MITRSASGASDEAQLHHVCIAHVFYPPARISCLLLGEVGTQTWSEVLSFTHTNVRAPCGAGTQLADRPVRHCRVMVWALT